MSQEAVTLPSGSELPIDVIGRASPDVYTTLSTTISSSGTTSLVVASATGAGSGSFPQTGSFVVRALSEEMLVTAGAGTTNWTVTRGYNNTQPLASIPSGTVVSQVVGVQRVEPVYAKKQITFHGRAASFQIPGRAGTAGQKLASIFNTNSAPNVLVDVQKVRIDLNSTAAKTVASPVFRLYKVTVAPTNGATLSKVPEDSTLSTSANVALLQDASADGTGATTALTSTLTVGTNVLVQTYPSQLYTVVGFSPFDSALLLPDVDEYITLNPGEGLVAMLDYTASTQNPTTDKWTVDFRWFEYTNA